MRTFYGRTNYEPPVTCARCGQKIIKSAALKVCAADIWYCIDCYKESALKIEKEVK